MREASRITCYLGAPVVDGVGVHCSVAELFNRSVAIAPLELDQAMKGLIAMRSFLLADLKRVELQLQRSQHSGLAPTDKEGRMLEVCRLQQTSLLHGLGSMGEAIAWAQVIADCCDINMFDIPVPPNKA